MNAYLLVYSAPGLHPDLADVMEGHVHGCLSSYNMGYTLIMCFESRSTLEEITLSLEGDYADVIISEVEGPDSITFDFRNHRVARQLWHPFDPENACKVDRSGPLDVDSILDKVNERGYDALTDEEKAFLKKNSS